MQCVLGDEHASLANVLSNQLVSYSILRIGSGSMMTMVILGIPVSLISLVNVRL